MDRRTSVSNQSGRGLEPGHTPSGANEDTEEPSGGRFDGGVRAALSGLLECPTCGRPIQESRKATLKLGSVEIDWNPLQISWCGKAVPLSRMESEMFAAVALRGRTTMQELDVLLGQLGFSPVGRRTCLMRIRKKFKALGAADPFEAIGQSGLRFRMQDDRIANTDPLNT